jgi:hypothetical protein
LILIEKPDQWGIARDRVCSFLLLEKLPYAPHQIIFFKVRSMCFLFRVFIRHTTLVEMHWWSLGMWNSRTKKDTHLLHLRIPGRSYFK